MNVKIDKVFRELEISNIDNENRTIDVIEEKDIRVYDKNKRYLNIYSSLMASPEGRFSESSRIDESSIHHFDWHFGVSTLSAKLGAFDWVGQLRADRSICIQVLIKNPSQECECIVMYSDINGFKPLNIMKDESTNYLSLAGSIIGGFSPFPNLSKSIESMTSEEDRKTAVKYENRFKNMFRLFRFLSEEGDQGIEYVLTKDVIDQWGTFLRGSFGLCFIGDPSSIKSTEYQITLMPKLGFKKNDHVCFLPSPEQQKKISAQIIVSVKA